MKTTVIRISVLFYILVSLTACSSDEPEYVDGNIAQKSLNQKFFMPKSEPHNIVYPAFFSAANDEKASEIIDKIMHYDKDDEAVVYYYYWFFRIEINGGKNIYSFDPSKAYLDISANGATVTVTQLYGMAGPDNWSHLDNLKYCSDANPGENWKYNRVIGSPEDKEVTGNFITVNPDETASYGSCEIYRAYQGHQLNSWTFTIPENHTDNFRAYIWEVLTDKDYYDIVAFQLRNDALTLKLLQLPQGKSV